MCINKNHPLHRCEACDGNGLLSEAAPSAQPEPIATTDEVLAAQLDEIADNMLGKEDIPILRDAAKRLRELTASSNKFEGLLVVETARLYGQLADARRAMGTLAAEKRAAEEALRDIREITERGIDMRQPVDERATVYRKRLDEIFHVAASAADA